MDLDAGGNLLLTHRKISVGLYQIPLFSSMNWKYNYIKDTIMLFIGWFWKHLNHVFQLYNNWFILYVTLNQLKVIKPVIIVTKAVVWEYILVINIPIINVWDWKNLFPANLYLFMICLFGFLPCNYFMKWHMF